MQKNFNVKAHGKGLKVILLDSVAAVRGKWDKLYGKAATEDDLATAFFVPPHHRCRESSYGTIYLPRRHPQVTAYVIHECTHAAINQARELGAEELDASAEENVAILTGLLAARVLSKLSAHR